MKARRLLAACSALACIGAAVACGSKIDAGTPDGGSGDAGGTDGGNADARADAGRSSGGSGAVPPPLPAGATVTPSSAESNFAVQTLLLGDVPRGSSAQSPSAWKEYGFNLDGKISTPASTDLCTPAAGAQKALVYADGTNGIDNSFGENILPILLDTAGADLATQNNQAITSGQLTIEIDTKGLSADGAQTNSGLTGYLNPAGAFDPGGSAVPTFTTSDNWPVLNVLLTNASDPSTSKAAFPNAYVANGTWVSAPFGSSTTTIPVDVFISSIPLTLTIHDAIITFDHTSPTRADNGTIAGVINTEELITQFKMVAGRISTELCSGSAFDGIAAQIRQASDILSDGTNTAGVPCDGISIGLGFVAPQIAVTTTAVSPPPPGPDPCADAG